MPFTPFVSKPQYSSLFVLVFFSHLVVWTDFPAVDCVRVAKVCLCGFALCRFQPVEKRCQLRCLRLGLDEDLETGLRIGQRRSTCCCPGETRGVWRWRVLTALEVRIFALANIGCCHGCPDGGGVRDGKRSQGGARGSRAEGDAEAVSDGVHGSAGGPGKPKEQVTIEQRRDTTSMATIQEECWTGN